jgi:glycosyltransferase involved in cell wall biosynthesis
MKVSMPSGRAHGWGIAGEYLTREIAKLPNLEGVTLHCISGHDLRPMNPDDWNRINIGYCFFENDIEAFRHTRRAAGEWDFIVAGSSWCEYQLRIGGFHSTSTILQGIDPANFYPMPPRQDDGRFIVFSGGKFEYRKGQDLVIAAMRVFMQRHHDAYLAGSWINQWPFSLASMAQSPHISFRHSNEDCITILQRTLYENGIPPERVYLAPLVDNTLIRQIYQQTDIGLFPNRCEGGNNMVMCEYMACGRTVIASDATGHADVVTSQNAFPLSSYSPVLIKDATGEPSAIWHEASVEEIIEQLELVYQNRDMRALKGQVAANDMKQLAWDKAASKFHAIGTNLACSLVPVQENCFQINGTDLSKQVKDSESGVCGAITIKFPIKRHCRICDKHAYMVFEDSRPFYLCNNCGLIFSDCSLSQEEIKKHYQSQYANNFDWNKEAKALLEVVRFAVTPRKIFDFGSGSGLLADAFRSMGCEVDNYEPMFHGDFRAENYNNSSDLVILNEVIEHIEDVLKTFDNVYSVTRPGGIIFIKTLTTDAIVNESNKFQELFNNWWYKDDQTHVSFFCQRTFEYICAMKNNYQLQMLAIRPNGVILQRA